MPINTKRTPIKLLFEIIEEDFTVINGTFLTLTKGNEKRTFFLFPDGYVREMTKGMGCVLSGKSFSILYNRLIERGYTEE